MPVMLSADEIAFYRFGGGASGEAGAHKTGTQEM